MKFAIVSGSQIGTTFQNRPFNEANLNRLTESVKQLGFLQAVCAVMVGEALEGLIGFNRIRVSQLTGIKLPCMIYPEGLTRPQIIKMQMTENHVRAQMSLAETIDQLLVYIEDTGLKPTQAGKDLNLAPSVVSALLSCQRFLHPDVLFQLSNAKIGYSIAAELAKADHEKQLELLPSILDGSRTKAEIAKAVRTPTTKHYRLTFTTPVSYDDLVAQLSAISTKLKTMQKQNIPFDLARKALD